MTKEELKEKIAELQGQAAELQAELERLERRSWKPSEDEEVFHLSDTGEVYRDTFYRCDSFHKRRLDRGLIFPTREEAELADRKRIAVKAIKDYVAENMPFTPDWDDAEQDKWSIFYAYPYEQWETEQNSKCRSHFLLPHVSSKLEVLQLIRDCKEHLDVLLEEL